MRECPRRACQSGTASGWHPAATRLRRSPTARLRCRTGSPPAARSGLDDGEGGAAEHRFTSARAGVSRSPPTRSPLPSSAPRASGGVPFSAAMSVAPDWTRECSPRERGCPGRGGVIMAGVRVLPARAGVSRRDDRPPIPCRRAPRASGGVPSTSLAVPALLRAPGGAPRASGGVPTRLVGDGLDRPYSLRKRGCPGSGCCRERLPSAFPARAGVYRRPGPGEHAPDQSTHGSALPSQAVTHRDLCGAQDPSTTPVTRPAARPSLGRIWGVPTALGSAWGESTA